MSHPGKYRHSNHIFLDSFWRLPPWCPTLRFDNTRSNQSRALWHRWCHWYGGYQSCLRTESNSCGWVSKQESEPVGSIRLSPFGTRAKGSSVNYLPKFQATCLAIEGEVSYIHLTRAPKNSGRIPVDLSIESNFGLRHYRECKITFGTVSGGERVVLGSGLAAGFSVSRRATGWYHTYLL